MLKVFQDHTATSTDGMSCVVVSTTTYFAKSSLAAGMDCRLMFNVQKYLWLVM